VYNVFFTLWCVVIIKNTRGKFIGVKLGLSRNQNYFRRWSGYRSKTASNRKLPNYKIVGNLTRNVLDITFNWFRIRTAEKGPIYCNPRWGDGNPRSYIKGGNLTHDGHPIPRICGHQSHFFCLPHGSHFHEGGLLRSHEGRGLRGGAPHDAGGREGAPRVAAGAAAALRSSLPPSSFSALSTSQTSPFIQCFILPHTSVPFYVNMVLDAISYNPMIYICHVCVVYLLIAWLNVFGSLELYVDMVQSFNVYYICGCMD
jgi:hypothetical protein